MMRGPDPQEQIDALREEVQGLRKQLAGGVGVPDYRPYANGAALTISAGLPTWIAPTTYVGSVTAGAPLSSTAGLNPVITHDTSGVAAGTYTYAAITINATGHITSAANGTSPVITVAGTAPISVATSGTTRTVSHATSGVTANTYAYPTSIGVNAFGHVTSVTAGSAPAAAMWGSIGGFIATQTDLQNALALKASLAVANTWTGVQTYGNTAVVSLTQNDIYSPTAIAPASTTTWYRIATLPHVSYGQEATIFANVHRNAGGGEALYKFVISKTTNDGATGTQFAYQLLGRFAAAYGISNARVVDGGTNNASYLDVQFKTTEAQVVGLAADTRTGPLAAAVTLGLASQGTGAAGTSWACDGNYQVLGTTGTGVYESTSTAGKVTFASIGLPGNTAQYIRGDGSTAAFPAISSGTVTSVGTGVGLTGGPFSTSGTVSLGTPSTCTASTSNNATGTTHTHSISGFMPTTGGVFTGAITAPGVTDSSDAKFKENVRALRGGLDIVRALFPVRFHNLLTNKDEVGLVAQDAQNVLPEIVTTDANGDLAVAYQRLVAPIIEALQQIDERLRALEAR